LSDQPSEIKTRDEITQITSLPAIATGIVVWLLFCFIVPPFLLLLPLVLVILAALFMLSQGNDAKAKKIARSHLAGRTSDLEIVESAGTATALALNDWGVVYVSPGKRPVEMAWSEINSVEETGIGVLAFRSSKSKFEIDCSLGRYMLITETIYNKIPERTDFDIDPSTCKSRILAKLESTPREWTSRKGRLVVSASGVEFNDTRLNWNDISSVTETYIPGDETAPYQSLTFSSWISSSFEVPSDIVSREKEIPRFTGFDLLKLIVREKLPSKTDFRSPVLTPLRRAIEEFERSWEAAKGGFAFALKSGKFSKIENNYFKHILRLCDRFKLDETYPSTTRDFFHDYAQLLERTGRKDEAEEMLRRSK
jgi:hypothetical protein